MEKTFIMSVKKKYEVHVTTDLNCEETYAPEGDNTIDLEKNLENIISFFIYPIYLIYNFLYTNFHSIIIFIWVGKICKKIDAICLKTFPVIKILLYIFLGIGMLYGLISGKQEIGLLISIFSIFLTCSLISKFKWQNLEICVLLNMLITGIIFRVIVELSKYITLPSCLYFLSLNNLGNTTTYIGLVIALTDIYFQAKTKRK